MRATVDWWFRILLAAALLGAWGLLATGAGNSVAADGASCGSKAIPASSEKGSCMSEKIERTDEEWRKILTEEQYRILRRKGTERPFSGEYYHHKEKGIYLCAGCGAELFSSEAKYDSGSGWPSFWAPISPDRIATAPDNSLLMERVEAKCARCGGHLGHVFEDGPEPTGLRYCVNSASLKFKPEE